MGSPVMEDMAHQISSIFRDLSNDRKKRRKLLVKEAMKCIFDEEVSRLINDEDIKTEAIESVEQNGIVFIDEIDTGDPCLRAGYLQYSYGRIVKCLVPLVHVFSFNFDVWTFLYPARL